MNDNSKPTSKYIPPPPRDKQPATSFFSGLSSGLSSGLGLGNLFGPSSPSSSSSSPPPPPVEQPGDDSFKYETDIPDILKAEFENLAEAINTKNKILKNYEKLLPALKYLKELLSKLGTERTKIENEKRVLDTKMAILEKERDEIEQNLESINSNRGQFRPIRDDFESNELRKKEMNEALSKKDAEIQLIKDKIAELEKNSTLNAANIENIRKLVTEATKYINNMKPTDDSNITQIIQLINDMQTNLGADEKDVRYLKIDNNDRDKSIIGMIDNPLRIEGGYRYSSSQMRRKSTARRSSASGSSSSKRRRNKKRTAKKMMLGGKRMKKAKSIKRKNHKKC